VTTRFAITWDYRCPFARIAHDHVVTALKAGAGWDVEFLPFSLDQTHVEEGRPPVWEEPERYPALLANLAGIVVRDRQPDRFLDVHEALFQARHDDAMDLRQRDVVAKVLDSSGVDAPSVLAEVDAGWPLEVLREAHTDAASRLQVFGVPTFIVADRATFVRLMSRPAGDADVARRTVERIVDMMQDWPELNEFKHTSLSN
jgi:hypothetical protein